MQSLYDLRLVAKDLEQATRIGLQGKTRHRVVSLLGVVLEFRWLMKVGDSLGCLMMRPMYHNSVSESDRG